MIDGHWIEVRDGDCRGLGLYLRHYSARKARGLNPVGSVRGNRARFVGPGEKLVLLTADASAVFAWRFPKYRQDEESGVECTIFRNEGPTLSSELIREAVKRAWAKWPGERLFTFVDPKSVGSSNPGWCFIQAGWTRLKRRTKKRGHRVLELLPPAEAARLAP